MAPLSIVIVAYQSGEFLRRCLAAVADCAREIVVVDNGSPAGETEALCAAFANVRLISPGRNEGFARAANMGVAACSGRWVLLLNPDAWPEDGAVDRLLHFAEEEPRLGAAGPLLFDASGHPQRSTIRPPSSAWSLALWAAFPRSVSRAYGALRGRALRAPRPAEFLQGSALLLRRAAFERVGGFDESFFMYGEDADLCARLREDGWGVAICSDARFVHVGGGSTSDGERMAVELLRSWLRLIAKRRGLGQAERARRWVLTALRLRRREPVAAAWLASGHAAELLAK